MPRGRALALVGFLLAFAHSVSAQQALGHEFQVNTYTTASERYPSVGADAAGNFLVVWERHDSFYAAYGQRYDGSGTPIGGEFQVTAYSTATFYGSPSVAMAGDGKFVVAWQAYGEGDGTGIFARRFDATGDPQEFYIPVNAFTTGSQQSPKVGADANGNFVVVWVDYAHDGSGQGIFGQRFDASGTKLGGEFQVNSYTVGTQYRPQLSVSSAGNFVVAWMSYNQNGKFGAFGQSFDAAGNRAGGEFQVNTTYTGSQYLPTVAADASGAFVVAWTQPDGSYNGVRAQRFDATASPIGADFAVSSTITGNQQASGVAMNDSGAFEVVWNSKGQDGSGDSVFAKAFAADGSALGGEFQVNTYTTGKQADAAIAPLGTTGFVAAWRSKGQDGSSDGVFGRTFATSATAVRFKKVTQAVAESAGTVTIKVVRTGDTSGSSTVDFATADGTAVAPGDYTSGSGTVIFAPGESSKTFALPIVNDAVAEGLETFSLTLTNPVGAALAPPATTTIQISDDDGSVFSLDRTQYQVAETTGHLNVTVHRTGAMTAAGSVTVKTVAGTATADTDYKTLNTVLSFAPGVATMTVPVKVLTDISVEGPETFTVKLAAPVGGTLGTQKTATVTIIDGN